MKNKKVILGMSGGVDSSVAALLLQKQGYNVIGMFMNASLSDNPPWPSSIKWRDEEKTLREICERLNIKLIVKDCEQGYEKNVITPMFKDYEKGLTPNPDILCNNVGKFPLLLKVAKEEKASFIATGHYARIRRTKNGAELYQAKDKTKDQSYFLVGLGQKTLKKILFPIGHLTKSQVREIARKNNLPNFDKRSSRGICYLGKIDMKSFLKERIKSEPGNIISPENKIVGTHPGAFYFTIGERVRESKGLILDKEFRRPFSQKKFYVAKKTKNNELVIAPQSHPLLKIKSVRIHKFTPVSKIDLPKSGLKARIRHLGKLVPGKLTKNNFSFSKPQEGIAEGQYIVLYKGARLIGGGEIRLH